MPGANGNRVFRPSRVIELKAGGKRETSRQGEDRERESAAYLLLVVVLGWQPAKRLDDLGGVVVLDREERRKRREEKCMIAHQMLITRSARRIGGRSSSWRSHPERTLWPEDGLQAHGRDSRARWGRGRHGESGRKRCDDDKWIRESARPGRGSAAEQRDEASGVLAGR